MNYFIDISKESMNKYGEELCGDNIEIIRNDDDIIIVLSDGLGSGVKANILSTLTSKIAVTMLNGGASIEETVNTIVNTLPECSVRKLAYSTFSIIKIHNDGTVYMAEYDNPPVFIYRNGFEYPLEKQEKVINEKVIFESRFKLQIGDMISVVSDGAIHAGVGAFLNLGWQWDNVRDYLLSLNETQKTASDISSNFISVCNNLYDDHPGDDTSIITIKVRENEIVDLFTGPPTDKAMDHFVIKNLIASTGKKVICGGTTSNIAARELGTSARVLIDTITKDIPPMGEIKGFDLVTEGVLTLKSTLEIIKDYSTRNKFDNTSQILEENNGASKLAHMLIKDCTHLNLWVGKAINPAHQNPAFPLNLNIKIQIVEELVSELKKLGKQVNLTYI